MEPAATIIRALGGQAQVARITGVFRNTPAKWCAPVEKGGTGGVIPFKHAPILIMAAREKGIELTADDFLPGATPFLAPGAAVQQPAGKGGAA